MTISATTPLGIPSVFLNTANSAIFPPSFKQNSISEKRTSGGSDLSDVTSFAVSMQLTELNYSIMETNFAFRKDNSLALQASSTKNYKLNSEVYKFEIMLTA